MLEVRGLTKRFGGVTAVDGVNLSVSAGEVVGLAGPNGAGKSTLLEMLSGRVKADEGIILLEGRPLHRQSFSLGDGTSGRLFRAYQVPRLFPAHTVSENLFLGKWALPNGTASNATAHSIVSLLDPCQLAGTLSVGQRRRLVLSWLYQRLSLTEVFLLDEPSAGGDQAYVDALIEFVKTARAYGKGILIVEHDRKLLSAVTDRTLHMEAGRIGETEGGSISDTSPVGAAPYEFDGNRKLVGSDLWVSRDGATIIKGLSISVAPREIVGVIGSNGSGKSTALMALYGDPKCKLMRGSVLYGEAELRPASPLDRIRRGIHLLPQEGGVFKSMTVAEMLLSSVECCLEENVNYATLRAAVSRVPHIDKLLGRRCGALSGGERRLVGLARILGLSPHFVLLDEPSAGLDKESQKRVGDLIKELAAQGVGVVMAEQSRSIIKSVCNRFVYLDANTGEQG